MPMKVLLVQPPYPFSEFPKPSWALMSLGAVLRQQGAEVKVLDLLSTRYTPRKIEECLSRFQPDLIGATCVTMNFPSAMKILKHCKTLSPQCTTLMGGPHVTFTAAQTLNDFPEVDMIVRGEGEGTLRELIGVLGKGGDLRGIKGLSFRSNGAILQTEERPFISDLNTLPLPDRTLFPLSRYLAMRVPASVLTSRGCPTGCSFCVGYRMTGRRGRFRDPLRVVDEMEAARLLGFEEICIDDDLFTRNRRHVFRICDEISRRGLKGKMYLFARVDTVDPVLLRKLKDAGCAMICFGMESGNQSILDRALKRTTLEKARQAVQMCKDAGISPFGSFILGLPGETRETMEETNSFARSLGIPYGFHLLSPFPGTRIREKAAEYGIRILTDDWSLYDADHAVTETESLRASEVEEFARSFFQNLGTEIENMKRETLAGTYTGPYREEMEKRLEVELAWKISSGDLVEEQGEISPSQEGFPGENGNPLKVLAQRISTATFFPLPFVETKLRKLAERRLLICEKKSQSHRWRWKDD